MRKQVSGLGVAGIAVALLQVAVTAGVAEAPTRPATLSLVQALPGHSLDVRVDEREVGAARSGDVLGPLRLSPGAHVVSFSSTRGRTYSSTVRIGPGGVQDVVLHPAAGPDMRPVLTTFRTPQRPVAPTKGRLLVAMAATVAPADVRIDGRPLVVNIANAEFATADVPRGRHALTVAPTGTRGPLMLGPVELAVPARTATMVYIVGRASTGPTDVIVHRRRLRDDGSVAPDTVRTGTAGLADPRRGAGVRP